MLITTGSLDTVVNGTGTHKFCFNERRRLEMVEEIRRFIGLKRP